MSKTYQSPRWGAIACISTVAASSAVSIPAMGGNSKKGVIFYGTMEYQSPRWGAIDQDYVGRFHYNRKR